MTAKYIRLWWEIKEKDCELHVIERTPQECYLSLNIHVKGSHFQWLCMHGSQNFNIVWDCVRVIAFLHRTYSITHLPLVSCAIPLGCTRSNSSS